MPYKKRKLPNHTRIYLEAFGYDLEDPTQFVECEVTGNRGIDIMHIIGRGRGGEDRIENLMAGTRMVHNDYGDKNIYIPTLLLTHRTFLKQRNVPFDNDWFEEKLKHYTYKSGS